MEALPKFRDKDGKISGQFSTNLLDIIATGIYKNIDNLSSTAISNRLNSLWEKQREQIQACTGSGSNTANKLKLRLTLGEEAFSL